MGCNHDAINNGDKGPCVGAPILTNDGPPLKLHEINGKKYYHSMRP